MAKKKESVYLDRWLSFHPYKAQEKSDFYYLKLCNETYRIMEKDSFLKPE